MQARPEILSVLHSNGNLLALLPNVRLGWGSMIKWKTLKLFDQKCKLLTKNYIKKCAFINTVNLTFKPKILANELLRVYAIKHYYLYTGTCGRIR